MAKKLIDKIGLKFGMLTVKGELPREYVKYKKGRPAVLRVFSCDCDCGKKDVPIHSWRLTKKREYAGLSCGCGKYIGRTHHGHSSLNRDGNATSEYRAWASIKSRCLNQSNHAYCWYGARGITICDEWKENFSNFLNDMGLKLTKKHSIDRIDNNKGYYKENCRWATALEQNNNKRGIKLIEYKGDLKSVAAWFRELNLVISKDSFRNRIKKGLSIEEIVNEFL